MGRRFAARERRARSGTPNAGEHVRDRQGLQREGLVNATRRERGNERARDTELGEGREQGKLLVPQFGRRRRRHGHALTRASHGQRIEKRPIEVRRSREAGAPPAHEVTNPPAWAYATADSPRTVGSRYGSNTISSTRG